MGAGTWALHNMAWHTMASECHRPVPLALRGRCWCSLQSSFRRPPPPLHCPLPSSVPLPPVPQFRAMGYEQHPVPGVPSYTPLEQGRPLRSGAMEEAALGDAEAALDDR